MAKKRFTHDDAYDEDEELLLDRKAKRKRERELERQRQEEVQQETQTPVDDTMSRMVAACQANQWREASVICLTSIEKFTQEGHPELAEGIRSAFQKIDRSLRRQMIAAFVKESEKLLSKE